MSEQYESPIITIPPISPIPAIPNGLEQKGLGLDGSATWNRVGRLTKPASVTPWDRVRNDTVWMHDRPPEEVSGSGCDGGEGRDAGTERSQPQKRVGSVHCHHLPCVTAGSVAGCVRDIRVETAEKNGRNFHQITS